MLELLPLFESGPAAGLDLKRCHLLLLRRYSGELELLKRTFHKQKEAPPIGRCHPPVQTTVQREAENVK